MAWDVACFVLGISCDLLLKSLQFVELGSVLIAKLVGLFDELLLLLLDLFQLLFGPKKLGRNRVSVFFCPSPELGDRECGLPLLSQSPELFFLQLEFRGRCVAESMIWAEQSLHALNGLAKLVDLALRLKDAGLELFFPARGIVAGLGPC